MVSLVQGKWARPVFFVVDTAGLKACFYACYVRSWHCLRISITGKGASASARPFLSPNPERSCTHGQVVGKGCCKGAHHTSSVRRTQPTYCVVGKSNQRRGQRSSRSCHSGTQNMDTIPVQTPPAAPSSSSSPADEFSSGRQPSLAIPITVVLVGVPLILAVIFFVDQFYRPNRRRNGRQRIITAHRLVGGLQSSEVRDRVTLAHKPELWDVYVDADMWRDAAGDKGGLQWESMQVRYQFVNYCVPVLRLVIAVATVRRARLGSGNTRYREDQHRRAHELFHSGSKPRRRRSVPGIRPSR